MLMPIDNGKTVLFFTADSLITPEEQSVVDRLGYRYQYVNVHNSQIPLKGQLRPADALAGAIPQWYQDAIANYPDGDVTLPPEGEPDGWTLLPGPEYTVNVSIGQTFRLYAVTAEYDEDTDTLVFSDRTVLGMPQWTSSDDTKATVDSGGIVTGVAAGNDVVITWSWEYETGKPITASRLVNVLP